MKRPLRILVLISLAFILKVVSSCVRPSFDFEFDFSKITVTNLDNSDIYAMRSDRDTMYSEALAFEVTLSDDELFADGGLLKTETAFPGFTPASAMSPEFRYHPRHQIISINIVTLEELSPSVPAGSDVTQLFVANVPHYFTRDFLYIKADELSSIFNLEYYPGEPSVTFQLFCREEILNSKARFSITATLSDDSTLAAATSMITIILAD